MPEDDADSQSSDETGFTRQPMDSISIGQAVERGKSVGRTRIISFDYMYDFGNPTELTLRIYEDRWDDGNGEIHLLARNHPPSIRRDSGLAPAAGLSEDCAAKQPDANTLPPIVNSPRNGACSYAGDEPDNHA